MTKWGGVCFVSCAFATYCRQEMGLAAKGMTFWPIVARLGAGLAGGWGGAEGGYWLGGKWFGEGSLGQKVTGLGFGVVGALLGDGLASRRFPTPQEAQIRAQQAAQQAASETRNIEGLRRPSKEILSDDDIARLTKEFEEVGGDPAMLRFNQGQQTGYLDKSHVINVRGDVYPSEYATSPRSTMSSRATLAHELGHAADRGTDVPIGAWNDEFRASYWAAKNAPNLTQEERADLIADAISRAREAGVPIRNNDFMRSILYGF